MILSLFQITSATKNHNNTIPYHLTHSSLGVISFSMSLFKFPCLSSLSQAVFVYSLLFETAARDALTSQTIVQSPNFAAHQIRITYFLQSSD